MQGLGASGAADDTVVLGAPKSHPRLALTGCLTPGPVTGPPGSGTWGRGNAVSYGTSTGALGRQRTHPCHRPAPVWGAGSRPFQL